MAPEHFTTDPFDDDKLKEECAVFGIYGQDTASASAVLGLHSMQHRGHEASGIVSFDGEIFHAHRAKGKIGDTFTDSSVIEGLPGHAAIGHNRYATSGGAGMRNVQPLFAEFDFGGLAICHNGNLTNAATLRQQLVKRGALFQSTSDTEVIIQLMAQSNRGGVEERLVDALRQVEGAYSLILLTNDGMMGVRDSLGVRPLMLGKLDDSYLLASETCAFDIMGAEFVREIEPGELVKIKDGKIESFNAFEKQASRFCIFEYVYFSRPDSLYEDQSVYEVRKNIGVELARENPIEADLVVPVPDSGVPAAIGYSAESGLPFELGIIRNHYVGRTFIQPSQDIRNLGVKLKHNANRSQLAGKRVVLVDDSIVRGTTSTKIVQMVRDAGASEVHMRIASPPTAWSCFYGVDTPNREKLLAFSQSVQEMCDYIGADSLSFISIDGLYRAIGKGGRDEENPQFCDACFTGDYPIRLLDHDNQADKKTSLLSHMG